MPGKTRRAASTKKPSRKSPTGKGRNKGIPSKVTRSPRFRFLSKAPVDLAFAWLTDLAESDHNGPQFTERRKPGTVVGREILSMDQHEAVIKDTWGKQVIYTRARFFPGDRIEYEWGESADRFRPWTVWRFDPGAGGAGCVIVVEFMDGVSPRIARSSADGVKRDAEKHIREMEDGVLAQPDRLHREVIIRRK